MPTKFRIVYTVIEKLPSRSLEGAREQMDQRSDDLLEYCDNAIDRSTTSAKLQRMVKGASGWGWENVSEDARA
jgi:hypothetical protein